MNLVAQITQINLGETNEWSLESTEENLDMLKRTGLSTPHPVLNKEGKPIGAEWKIVNKHLLLHIPTNKRYVFKGNTFKPSPEVDLDISTAVNEFMWYAYAKKLGLSEHYLPVQLAHIYVPGKENKKPGKKLCSYTELLEEYKNLNVWKAFEPEVFNKLHAKGINNLVPMTVRIFAALAGVKISPNDIIFNREGDFRVLDNADADPKNVDIYVDKLLESLNSINKNTQQPSHTKEQKEEIYQQMRDYLQTLILEKDSIIEEVYSTYNRVNLTRHPAKVATASTPATEARPAGLSVYEDIWGRLSDKLEDMLGVGSEKLKAEPLASEKLIIEDNSIIDDIEEPKVEENALDIQEVVESVEAMESEPELSTSVEEDKESEIVSGGPAETIVEPTLA